MGKGGKARTRVMNETINQGRRQIASYKPNRWRRCEHDGKYQTTTVDLDATCGAEYDPNPSSPHSRVRSLPRLYCGSNIYNSYPFTCDTDVVDAINWDCFNSMLFNTTRWYDRYKIVHNYTPENDPFCTCSAFWNEFSPCGYSNNPPFVRRDFSAIVPPCTAISWLITIRGKRGFQQIQCADGRLFVRSLEECPVTIEVSPPIRIPLNPERCCPSWVPVFPVNPNPNPIQIQ